MLNIKRTDSTNQHFLQLVKELDEYLRILDGEDHHFYAQFNKVAPLKYVIVAYDADVAVGCGAMKEYAEGRMEIKRMYVTASRRQQGIASVILRALEQWAMELNFKSCLLETGKRQPEAIELYSRNGYRVIPNFGQYASMENSICFEKELGK